MIFLDFFYGDDHKCDKNMDWGCIYTAIIICDVLNMICDNILKVGRMSHVIILNTFVMIFCLPELSRDCYIGLGAFFDLECSR